MYVDYSGWMKEEGYFHYSIYIDETSMEHEIEYEDGFIAKQTSVFKEYTYDWNNDEDVYTQYGAFFESRYGGGDFFTPEELVRSLVDFVEGVDDGYNYRVVAIKGIELPEPMQQNLLKRRGR